MILLRVIGDHVVDPPGLAERFDETGLEPLLDRVDERRRLRAADHIGIVARALGQRDQRVEQARIPIDRADPVDAFGNGSRLHAGGSFLCFFDGVHRARLRGRAGGLNDARFGSRIARAATMVATARTMSGMKAMRNAATS